MRALHLVATVTLVLGGSQLAIADPGEAPGPGPARRGRLQAPATVLTEHPSSLAHLQRQFARIKQAIPKLEPTAMIELLNRPWIAGDKQVQEFKDLSLKKKLATAKMIDFEGKPMVPETIPGYLEAYVKGVERAKLGLGLDSDRLFLVRLPGAAETNEKDVAMRAKVFEGLVESNLRRVLRGQSLPFERLIIPEALNLGQMIEVHDTYDRTAGAAVDRLVQAGKLPTARRVEVLDRLRKIQVVPLVENADRVLNANRLVSDYLGVYRQRFGTDPKQFILFVAGSDLNREIGPVAGQVARAVMRSRVKDLEQQHPATTFIQWAGIGSGPMRSGPGRFAEKTRMLHPGMTFTVQPDQIDQPNLANVLLEMERATFRARGRRMSPEAEQRLLAVGAAFADVHAKLSLRNALATVRLNNLLTLIQQRGRKASASKLVYEKDGKLYLRSAQPKEQGDGATYGRTLDISGYGQALDPAFRTQQRTLEGRQAVIDAHWPRGLSDPRAIGGAFARYVEGGALTTVSGLGHAVVSAQARMGKREVNRLRPFLTFLVKNDGFVLTRDRELTRRRIQVLQPHLSPAQVERQVSWHFEDLRLLEGFLGKPVEQLINTADRAHYERESRALYASEPFVRYMRGEDISLEDWAKVMDRVVPLLSNPSWNRIGALPAPDTGRLAA